MADGTIRLALDLLSGNEADMASAYPMMREDITMILVKTEDLENEG